MAKLYISEEILCSEVELLYYYIGICRTCWKAIRGLALKLFLGSKHSVDFEWLL